MRTLKKHLILFDAECPMCRAYTQLFVGSGLLDKDGRIAYQEFSAIACPMLDRQRAANEIALVNQETGEVTYGIESLFKVFATAIPLLKPLFSFKPFVWLSSKLYAFISYNRRVIIPTSSDESFQLQPAFKLHYRLAYLLFAWILTAVILSDYVGLMKSFLPGGNAFRECLVCGGQIFFQGAVVALINRKKTWEYLGNMMTISLAGALVLLPMILVAEWLPVPPFLSVVWFLATAALMLLEHLRRSRLLKLDGTLTLSWVLYRILVLFFILITE